MTKHTPGPWTTGGFYVKAADGHIMIADVTCGNGPPTDEEKANAHLIAAAPDMYEALVALTCSDNDVLNDGASPVWAAAMKAIAKAEGK